VSCTIKQLPPELRAEGVRVAVEENPQNAVSSAGRGLAALMPPEALALLTAKRWGPKVDRSVRFLDTTNAELKAKILAYANEWGKYANVRYRETAGTGDVRLTLRGGGYWSYLGTDTRLISANQPTMSLHGFTLATPEGEYSRVVVHEFGHDLGFNHEHEQPAIQELLDIEKTIREFQRTQGWSRADVIQQIFSPPAPGEVTASGRGDARSIMCYSFPGSCTKSGMPIPGGDKLTDEDKRHVGVIYPKADAPPPPPPVEPPPVTGRLAFPVPPGSAVSLDLVDVVANLKAAGYAVTKS
jgi:hypothetical protein